MSMFYRPMSINKALSASILFKSCRLENSWYQEIKNVVFQLKITIFLFFHTYMPTQEGNISVLGKYIFYFVSI